MSPFLIVISFVLTLIYPISLLFSSSGELSLWSIFISLMFIVINVTVLICGWTFFLHRIDELDSGVVTLKFPRLTTLLQTYLFILLPLAFGGFSIFLVGSVDLGLGLVVIGNFIILTLVFSTALYIAALSEIEVSKSCRVGEVLSMLLFICLWMAPLYLYFG